MVAKQCQSKLCFLAERQRELIEKWSDSLGNHQHLNPTLACVFHSWQHNMIYLGYARRHSLFVSRIYRNVILAYCACLRNMIELVLIDWTEMPTGITADLSIDFCGLSPGNISSPISEDASFRLLTCHVDMLNPVLFSSGSQWGVSFGLFEQGSEVFYSFHKPILSFWWN